VGIVIRQSSISTILSFIGIAIGYLNVLYFFPMYLSPEEIGLTRVIQDFAMLLVPFAQLGTGHSIIRFFPKFSKNARSYANFFTLILSLASIGFLAFLLIFSLLKQPLVALFETSAPEVNDYLYLTIILVYIIVVYNIFIDFIRSNLNIVIPIISREILTRSFTTISIVLFVFGVVNFEGFLLCIVGGYLVNVVIISIYLRIKNLLKIRPSFYKDLTLKDMKPIFTYGLFALVGGGGAVIIAKVDSVMVTSMLGTHFNGIYTTAFYMAVVIEVPRRMITQISTPIIARSLENNRIDEISDIYRKSALNQLIIGSLLLIGILANLDNIYQLIPNNNIYILGKWIVVIIGIGKLIDMGAGLNGAIIILSKYYKVNILLTAFLAIVTIGANLLLIPRYGIQGAAFGTLFSLVIFNLIKFIFIYSKFGIQPFSFNNLKVLLIAGLVLAISLQFPSIDEVILDILIRSAGITIVFSSLILITKCSAEIEQLFNSLVGFIRKQK